MPRAVSKALALTTVLALYALVRLPLFIAPGIFHGWNSDAAILGLMARNLVEKHEFDFFFWGQNFIGPLTSMVAAGIGFARQAAGLTPAVAPIALRLATSLLVFGGIGFFWLALRRSSWSTATLAALFLAIGPPLLFRSSVVARAADMVIFLGGVIVWFAERHFTGVPRRNTWLGFGLLCGLSWWMNQQIFFFVVGALFLLVRRSQWFGKADVRLRERLRFDYPGIPLLRRRLLVAVEVLLALQLLYVVVRGLLLWPAPLPGFRWPFAEPLIALAILHLTVALWQRDPLLHAVPWREVARRTGLFAGGFLIAYAPVIAGRLFGWFPREHLFGMRFSHPDEVLDAIGEFFTVGLPTILGSPLAIVVAAGILGLWLREQRREIPPALEILLAAAVANLLYCLLTQRPGWKPHYLIAAVPGVWAFLAFAIIGIGRRRRVIGILAGAVLVVILGLQTLAVSSELRSDVDPRPVIEGLRREGCRVVYAEYWTAYKYRFLSNEEFLFVVHQSQDRSPEDSARFARAPGRRCLLARDRVSTFQQ